MLAKEIIFILIICFLLYVFRDFIGMILRGMIYIAIIGAVVSFIFSGPGLIIGVIMLVIYIAMKTA